MDSGLLEMLVKGDAVVPFWMLHPDGDYIFWPDLALAHYTKDSVTLQTCNIHFVPKEANPPSAPQL